MITATTFPTTLFIVSAPSGAGKTSLVRALLTQQPQLKLSVSHTTRSPRPGEINGEHYHFITPAVFERMIAAGAFLEHARVFDYAYGTAAETVQTTLVQGSDVILEIDWQGAQQIRAQLPATVSIFILPPSLVVLEQRLRDRGQDSDATIMRRMSAAHAELAHYNEYDYLVVNDDFNAALAQLQCIITAQRLRRDAQIKTHAALFTDLLQSNPSGI